MEELNPDQFPDLESAAIHDKELNHYLGYPNPEDALKYILTSNYQDLYEISTEELSVNGLVVSDSMEEYLATKAVSNSSCKEALKTPLHFFYYINQTIPKKDKSHFELGTFAHMAFLEPELFDLVKVEPKASLSSHQGCDKLLNFYADHINLSLEQNLISKEDYITINPYDFEGIEKVEEKKARIELLKSRCPFQFVNEEHKIIIDVIKSNYYRYGNGIIPKLLKGSLKEKSIYSTDPQTRLKIKIRPDALNVSENIGVNAIISFKTTTADNIQKFIYDTAKYGYELGEAMYQEVTSYVTGREFKSTIMIMLQTVPPYLPAVLWWDADDLENGKYKYRNALLTIHECQNKNIYPGFDAMAESGLSGIIKMKQPDWTMKELHPIDLE